MSTHGWAGTTRWNLGSVTLKVLLTAVNPVLVFRAQQEAKEDLQNERHLENIIVPLDGSAVSEEAIPHAMTLAEAHSAKVTLLRVTPSGWDYFSHMDHGVLHSGDLSKLARDRAKEYLDKVADKLNGRGSPQVEQRVAPGEPAGSIIDLAEETLGSLVTMVTHGQGSNRRWSMGSVAQRVAGGCQIPALVVPATGRGQDQ